MRAELSQSLYQIKMCYLQPSVDTLDVVVVETGQHPQLLSVGVITETDLTPVNSEQRVSSRQTASLQYHRES